MKGYRSVAFRGLGGGLNLRDSEFTEDQALDLLNVEFDVRGAVRQRDGYAEFTLAELINQPDSLAAHYELDGTAALIVGNGNQLDAFDDSAVSIDSETTTDSPHSFVRYGGPTSEATYIANGTDQIRKFDGTAFSSPAGLVSTTGKYLAVTPTSNRLVIANETGSTAGSNSSSVIFSDAGDPESIDPSNFVDLDPGDGEEITALVSWSNYVFAFKPSKFWIFYAESTDTLGFPVFNYRKVDTGGVGCVAPRTAVAARDGVYFMGRDGVYRTRGQDPEPLSSVIDPLFYGNVPLTFDGDAINNTAMADAAATVHDERVYLSVPTGGSLVNDRTLVYDIRYRWWSIYDIGAAAFTPFRVGSRAELLFAAASGENHIYRHSSEYVNDAMEPDNTGGTAITSYWRSAWFDYSDPEVKTVRETKLRGTGQAEVSLFRDDQTTPYTSTSVEFSSVGFLYDTGEEYDTGLEYGPSFFITSRLIRNAIRGRYFSIRFENDVIDEDFAIHSVVNHLREARIPSVTGVDT